MKEYLVISRSTEDKKLADRLRKDLREKQISVWVDADTSMGNPRHAAGFAEAIKQAKAVIFIAGRNSVDSTMVKMELAAAARSGVPIIVVAIDDAGMSFVSSQTKDSRKIDFRGDYSKSMEFLQAGLAHHFEHLRPSASNVIEAKNYIFLSYTADDTPYMEQVKEFLSKNNYTYWEYQESSRDYHTDLNLELEDVLRNATAMLSILSPEWKKSKWAMKEFSFAQEIGIPVVLLRFQDMGPTLATAGIPYIDFVGDKSKGFIALEKELRLKGLGKERVGEVPSQI